MTDTKTRSRLKLSTLILAIMVIAIIGHAALAVIFLRQQGEQGALAEEIDAIIQSLEESGDVASRLEQLASAESELAAEHAAFPAQLSGPGTVGALLQLAQDIGLKVADVKTQPGKEQQIGEHTYHALSVHIQVEGTLSALDVFISELEKGALPAARVDELSIAGIEAPPSPDGPGATKVQDSLTASLDFSVYARD